MSRNAFLYKKPHVWEKMLIEGAIYLQSHSIPLRKHSFHARVSSAALPLCVCKQVLMYILITNHLIIPHLEDDWPKTGITHFCMVWELKTFIYVNNQHHDSTMKWHAMEVTLPDGFAKSYPIQSILTCIFCYWFISDINFVMLLFLIYHTNTYHINNLAPTLFRYPNVMMRSVDSRLIFIRSRSSLRSTFGAQSLRLINNSRQTPRTLRANRPNYRLNFRP